MTRHCPWRSLLSVRFGRRQAFWKMALMPDLDRRSEPGRLKHPSNPAPAIDN